MNEPGKGCNPVRVGEIDLTGAVQDQAPAKKMTIIASEREGLRLAIRMLDEVYAVIKELTRVAHGYGNLRTAVHQALSRAVDAECDYLAKAFADVSLNRLLAAHPDIDDHHAEAVSDAAKHYAHLQLTWHRALMIDGLPRSLTKCPSLE